LGESIWEFFLKRSKSNKTKKNVKGGGRGNKSLFGRKKNNRTQEK